MISEARREYMRLYREKNREHLSASKKLKWKEYRLKVLSHYSDGTLQCACCGEAIYEFLALDHINGGGNQHRRELGTKYIYSWLIQNGYPEGYQVLCHNCNMAKIYWKVCPHKEQLLLNVKDGSS